MDKEISQQTDDFVNKLFQMRWLSKKHLAEELSLYQLTTSQYATLKILLDKPDGMKMSELAKQAHQVSATMTGIIDRLENQSLVCRTRQEADRRSVYVYLTLKGKNLLQEINIAKTAKFEEILNRLDDNQKAQLFDTIDIIIAYFKETLRENS